MVCEPYEELLWWLQMPALLAIAGEPAPSKAQLQALSEKVHAASAEADKAEYRLDTLLDPEKLAATPERESTGKAIQKGEPLESAGTPDATKVAEAQLRKRISPSYPKSSRLS